MSDVRNEKTASDPEPIGIEVGKEASLTKEHDATTINEGSVELIDFYKPLPIVDGQPEENQRVVTVRAVVLGCLTGALVNAANLYLGKTSRSYRSPRLPKKKMSRRLTYTTNRLEDWYQHRSQYLRRIGRLRRPQVDLHEVTRELPNPRWFLRCEGELHRTDSCHYFGKYELHLSFRRSRHVPARSIVQRSQRRLLAPRYLHLHLRLLWPDVRGSDANLLLEDGGARNETYFPSE